MEPPKWLPALSGTHRCTREKHHGPCHYDEMEDREWRKHSIVEMAKRRCPTWLRRAPSSK